MHRQHLFLHPAHDHRRPYGRQAVHIPRAYNAAADLIERNLAPDRIERTAYIDDAGSYSFGDLAGRVNRCANAWKRRRLRMEDRVAVLLLHDLDRLSRRHSWVRIKSGVIPIPCNTLLTAADYAFMLSDSRVRAVVISSPLLPLLRIHPCGRSYRPWRP